MARIVTVLALTLAGWVGTARAAAKPLPAGPGIRAAYAGILLEPEPRPDGAVHLDTPAMIDRLRALHANTYFYLVSQPTAWGDLQREFLPAATAAGIDLWVYLVPPSEASADRLPFGYDYVRTAEEIARLSLRYPHLQGLVIDDFGANVSLGQAGSAPGGRAGRLRIFTPALVGRMRAAGKTMAPRFRFYPLLYWQDLRNAPLIDAFAPVIDGVVFAYCDEPTRNTSRLASLPEQLGAAESLLASRGKSLVLMVYCWPLQSAPIPPSPEYVRTAVAEGLAETRRGALQGVLAYNLELSGPGLPFRGLRPLPNYAHGGNGRASILASSTQPVPPGAFGEVGAPATIDPGTSRLRMVFWRLVTIPPWRRSEAFSLEVLWNGQVVWQEDWPVSARGPAGAWQREEADFTIGAGFRGPARLSFRLGGTESRPIEVMASFDDLATRGFTVRDPGFESGLGWDEAENHPAFLPGVRIFDPGDAIRRFEAVSTLYGEAGAP